MSWKTIEKEQRTARALLLASQFVEMMARMSLAYRKDMDQKSYTINLSEVFLEYPLEFIKPLMGLIKAAGKTFMPSIPELISLFNNIDPSEVGMISSRDAVHWIDWYASSIHRDVSDWPSPAIAVAYFESRPLLNTITQYSRFESIRNIYKSTVIKILCDRMEVEEIDPPLKQIKVANREIGRQALSELKGKIGI